MYLTATEENFVIIFTNDGYIMKKEDVLFNEELKTFYLVIWHWTYGEGPFR